MSKHDDDAAHREDMRAAYQRGQQLGYNLVATVAAWAGLPMPPAPHAREAATVPMDPMAVAVRLQSVIAADLARLSPGMVLPDALAEALFHTAIHVTLACRATGGPRRWAAGALLAACGSEAEAIAMIREVSAAMSEQAAADAAAEAEVPVASPAPRHPFRVIPGGKAGKP